MKEILNHQRLGVDVHVFMKKDDDEGTSFYYLGQVDVLPETAKEESMKDKNGNDVSVVTMNMNFHQPLPMNVFEYFHRNSV